MEIGLRFPPLISQGRLRVSTSDASLQSEDWRTIGQLGIAPNPRGHVLPLALIYPHKEPHPSPVYVRLGVEIQDLQPWVARGEVVFPLHPSRIPYQFVEVVEDRDGILVSLGGCSR